MTSENYFTENGPVTFGVLLSQERSGDPGINDLMTYFLSSKSEPYISV